MSWESVQLTTLIFARASLRGMKPNRPLFRDNGRFGTTPQCHGAFQDWIGDPLRGNIKRHWIQGGEPSAQRN